MKVYNVLFESNYEDEDIVSNVSSFKYLKGAKKCLKNAFVEELIEGGYSDEDAKKISERFEDRFAVYSDDTRSSWKFRGKIFECEIV